MSFLNALTPGAKSNTKAHRFGQLKAFFNFHKYAIGMAFDNPCDAPLLRKTYRKKQSEPWTILHKDLVDEMIFRTGDQRNRLILELMARGGMRISEVLKLRPVDVHDRKLLLRSPKSGKAFETVFIPQKLADRLNEYIRSASIEAERRIFPITYSSARRMVMKTGKLVGIHLRCHDLRRHAATYASRSGVPIEIISKIILRHAQLATTERYLGKVSDTEAVRWVENVFG